MSGGRAEESDETQFTHTAGGKFLRFHDPQRSRRKLEETFNEASMMHNTCCGVSIAAAAMMKGNGSLIGDQIPQVRSNVWENGIDGGKQPDDTTERPAARFRQ